MPYTEAQKRATLKYRSDNLSRITLDVPKDTKQLIQDAAAAAGLSVTKYLLTLVQRDTQSE